MLTMDKPKIVIQGLRQDGGLYVGVNIECNAPELFIMIKAFFDAIAKNTTPLELLLYKTMINEKIDKALGMDEREKGC